VARPAEQQTVDRRCRFVKEDGTQCRLPAATDKKANGYCYHHMGAQRRRTWGSIKSKSSGYQASYVGPDDQRHLGPTIFMAKVDAEVWLAKERRLIDLDEWTAPQAREDAAREAELRAKAAALTLREYADPWVQNRHNRNGQPLKARSQADYRRLLKAKIYPRFGDTELKDITKDDIVAWYRTMAKTPTEQASAYALLRTILTTAVEDERIAVNPCRAAGRPNLRFHDLRHTGATMAAQSGTTLKELMDRLGHTTPKAALVYQHTASDRDQLIAERLSARMSSVLGRS